MPGKLTAFQNLSILETITKYTDDELLIMMKQRNVAGLSFLYDKYAPAVYGVVLKETGNKEIAESTVEKAFLKIWSDPPAEERYTSHLLLWLLGVAKKIAPLAFTAVEVKSTAHENDFMPCKVPGTNYLCTLPM